MKTYTGPEARELREQATEGEWEVRYNNFDRRWGVVSIDDSDDFGTTWVALDEQSHEMGEDATPPNAHLIAAAKGLALTVEQLAAELVDIHAAIAKEGLFYDYERKSIGVLK